MTRRFATLVLLIACVCEPASAHSFGQTYNLPIPFWLYLYGAAAALVLSFLVIAYLVTSAPATHNARSHELLVLEPRR
ncbi:MAG: hypothetical protein ACRETW_10690, partial [Stenotrophobium sp.]